MRHHRLALCLIVAGALLAGCTADSPEESNNPNVDDCGVDAQPVEADSPRAKSDVDRPPGCPNPGSGGE